MIKIVALMPITTNNESTPFPPTATASHQLPSNWPQSNKHPHQHPSKPTKTTTTAITPAYSTSTIVTSNKYLMASLTHIIVYKQVQTVHLLLLRWMVLLILLVINFKLILVVIRFWILLSLVFCLFCSCWHTFWPLGWSFISIWKVILRILAILMRLKPMICKLSMS